MFLTKRVSAIAKTIEKAIKMIKIMLLMKSWQLKLRIKPHIKDIKALNRLIILLILFDVINVVNKSISAAMIVATFVSIKRIQADISVNAALRKLRRVLVFIIVFVIVSIYCIHCSTFISCSSIYCSATGAPLTFGLSALMTVSISSATASFINSGTVEQNC